MTTEVKGSTCCHDDHEPRVIRDEFDAGPEGERVWVVVEECPVEVRWDRDGLSLEQTNSPAVPVVHALWDRELD